MPWFEGTHEETRELPVTPEVAAAHFGNPEVVVAATKSLESSEIEGGAVHFVLTEEDYGMVKFKPDYRCTYEVDGTTVRWTAGEGNLRQSGEAVFTATEGGCSVAYRETVAVDLPVPSMMTAVLKPMLGPVLVKEVRAYLDRVVDALPGADG